MSTKVLIFAHSNLMIYLQPLIYDVLHTEGDFYLGNQDARQKVTEGDNAEGITNDEKAQSVSSEAKTKKRGGPKPKRSKKGKR